LQRTFLGEFVLSVADGVSNYKQAVVLNTVRVAYRKDERLYEAASPTFEPFRLADDGCNPVYSGTTLNYYSPCENEQLIRIDLSTGIKEEFAPDVAWSYIDKGVLFELTLEDDHDDLPPHRDETPHLFVTLAGRPRTEVVPFLDRYIEVIDSTHIAGRSSDRNFGIWNPDTGFEVLYKGVVDITPFIDTRSGSFVWLMLHELDTESNLATLSVFDQSDYEVTTLAEKVPTNRYSWEQLETVGEPVIVTIEDAKREEGVAEGELRARLLSGELGSSIDLNVTSYRMIPLPLPGLLYTVRDEGREGLWFAAL
jgi:hypothetical protein